MIKHFKKITGTGKYLQFNHTSSESKTKDFGKINLIYGNNGSGKTTLALLLRSLQGNDELLQRKRSFDRSVPQEVSIITDQLQDPNFEYDKGKWNQHLSDIEIFDVHFINDNIHTGLEIQNEHKKNLFEVILGKQGVQLKEEIAVLKERISKGNKVIRETGKLIEAHIGQAFTVTEYCDLEYDEDVEEKIKWKEQEIETASNIETIQKKPLLQQLPLIVLPYEKMDVESILQQSIDNISDDFLQQFEDHKNHLNMQGEAEEWIQEGFNAMQNETCPFCAQTVDSSKIIAVYQQYFNEEYRGLLEKISRLERAVESANLEANLFEIENKISSNLLLIDFWKKYVTAPINLQSVLDKKENLLNAFEKVKKVVEKKSKNPIHSQSIETLELLDKQVVDINDTLNGFNEKISFFNEGIETVKAAETPQMEKLQQEHQQLLAIQKRNLPEIVESCNNINTYSAAITRFRQTMKDKQAELDIFKQVVFTSFGNKVNEFLKIFAPYLQLKNLDSGYIGSSTNPMVKFGLYVNGNALNQKKNAVESTIKYSLSEGDKSAFALSFFMAKLELDKNLENKIIVLDDPISSFDNHRKKAMLEQLKKLSSRVNQLFLLTHDKGLANDFIKKIKSEKLEIHCYDIGFDGKSAEILNLDIDF